MTRWVETVSGGRDRGVRGLARAWVEVLVRPARFFERGVAPGDQAPGLAFAVCVAGVATASWLGTATASAPLAVEPPPVAYLLSWLGLTAFVAPVGLHLVAAVQTIAVLAGAPADTRAGVGETVQVVAYASAPCALSGLPVPVLRYACALYATALLAVGIAVRHGVSPARATVLSTPGALLAFGWAYQGLGAVPAAGAGAAALFGL
ncbi:MAG: YIP1 family protein [Halobacteriaceae archaeon]